MLPQGAETAFVTTLTATDCGLEQLAERRRLSLNKFKHCLLEVQRSRMFPAAPTGVEKLYETALNMCISASKAWKLENTPLQNLGDLMSNIVTMTDFRRVFVTKGGFVGLGPEATSPGDVCCVVAGADVPFIMRQQSSSPSSGYLLVGECYIDGRMHGEATKSHNGSERSWDNIIIT